MMIEIKPATEADKKLLGVHDSSQFTKIKSRDSKSGESKIRYIRTDKMIFDQDFRELTLQKLNAWEVK